MTTRFLQPCLTRLLGTLVLLIALGQRSPEAHACSFVTCPDITCHTFFFPKLGENEPVNQTSLDEVNVREWFSFWDGKVPEVDIRNLVYKTPIPEIDNLIFTIKGQTKPLNAESQAFLSIVRKNQLESRTKDALYYLGFAKRVEPLAVKGLGDDEWDSKPEAESPMFDKAAIEKLLQGGELQRKNAHTRFLQERYTFQMLRIYFYSKRYAEAIAYYEAHQSDLSDDSSIGPRFRNMGAGAYYKSGDFSKANYIYASLYNSFPPLRACVIASFHPKEESDWSKTLKMAKSRHEEESLWMLFGLKLDKHRAIKEIASRNPKSQDLRTLLELLVKESEERVFEGNDQNDRVLTNEITTLRSIADARSTAEPQLWNVATAHLLALSGQRKLTETYLFNQSNGRRPAPEVERQIQRTWLLAQVQSLGNPQGNVFRKPTSAEEKQLAESLIRLRTYVMERWEEPQNQDLYVWALRQLSTVYAHNKDDVRALLLQERPSSPFFRDNAKLDAMLAFLTKPRKSAFDAFLATPDTPDTSSRGLTVSNILDMKGVNLLYKGEYASAGAILAQSQPVQLPADPFLAHINDCHDCDHNAVQKNTLTYATFARKMDELSKATSQGGEAGARAHFDLATGLYNMSYYGNVRSVYETVNKGLNDELSRSLSMDESERHYLEAARLSKDREFQAKSYFMASKAEHNRQFKNPDPFTEFKFSAGPHFKTLAEQYTDTDYYKEVIRECGYFRTYLKKRETP